MVTNVVILEVALRLRVIVVIAVELVLGGTDVILAELDGVDVTMIVVLFCELFGGLDFEVVITGTEDEVMLEL